MSTQDRAPGGFLLSTSLNETHTSTTVTDRLPVIPRPRRPVEDTVPEDTGTGEVRETGEVRPEELISQLRELAEDDPRADELRERVVVLYQPLINKIARRYGGRGEPLEDLKQTAMVGLVKAVRGYDPARGKPFISYLLPTVTGEIKRHFR
ncbi:sigma-70 family RNA polymerase sigma factor, partial [Nocardiopsis dassonvillei]